MYNHNITIAEYNDFMADMLELSAPYMPTEAEMEEIYADAQDRLLAV